MKMKIAGWILFVAVAFVMGNIFANSSWVANGNPMRNPEPQPDDRAARNYANYCAGCHYDDMGWFSAREWKYGNSVQDIYVSTRTGYPDFGMPGYAKTFTEEEMRELAGYIHQKLGLAAEAEKRSLKPAALVETELLKLHLDTVITGLDVPWGMAFLPNGDMLVNERAGKMFRYRNGERIAEIEGLPFLHASGQGGLLDIRLHPDYETNGWIYFAYTTPSVSVEEGWNTALMRAKLNEMNQLTDKQLLFKAVPDSRRSQHVGCKITFDGKGHVFFGVGDRGDQINAQDLTNDCGKIHRLNEDGSIPTDNPFVKDSIRGYRPGIWSYGHRNPQGLVIRPSDGSLWESEHGPKGGDELNLIVPGKNYGWPVITYGINYDGTIITRDTVMAGMEQPVIFWRPSIAPCGMTFVTGNRYKGWEGNILIGSLRFRNLERLVLDGDKVIHKETLLHNLGRMRNVEISPDGYIYVAVEKPGMIIRLVPE